MTHVLEYITQNYTLFLFGAIIILLAVIGYYAEKTNFGQGKVDKTKPKKNTNEEMNLNDVELMDITGEVETNAKIESQNNIEDVVDHESDQLLDINSGQNLISDESMNMQGVLPGTEVNMIELKEEKKEIVNPIIDVIHKELNLVSNDVIFNVEEIKKKENKNKKSEEAFNKFSDEFDALLPEREIINDDLLSEIEDLELGKTQKFNLKDLKKFDNIKLPRISDTVTEDQDIWKF